MHLMIRLDTRAPNTNHISASGGRPNHPEARQIDAEQEGVYCIVYTVFRTDILAFSAKRVKYVTQF